MPRIPIIAVLFLLLLVLPVKLHTRQLKLLAFALWFMGGVMLTFFGFDRLAEISGTMSLTNLGIAVAIALVVGIGKGKTVLTKSSNRNIERLDNLTEPQKPIYVYSLRSWVVISVMMLIAMSLTWFSAPLFWRGVVNIAVGFGLITSSFAYLKSLKASTPNAMSV